jgi:hypothetical protein
MKMLYKIGVTLIFLLALNCKTTQNQEKMINEDAFLIGKGNLYGSGTEGIEKVNLVITSQSDWRALLAKLNLVNNVSNSFSETKIDFSKFTIIAVFDEVKATGGHLLDADIKTSSKNITVNIITQAPEGMATNVMTQPYYIVKITKSELPIIFSAN